MSERDPGEPGLPVRSTPAETAIEYAGAALGAVPIVGGALAEIAEGIAEGRRNARLNQFLLDLAADLRRLEDRVNQDFMRTEDFQNLAEDIIERAASTRQREKLEAFRAIFLNTILQQRPRYDEAAEIAELVDRLQDRHILMLRILYDPVRADTAMGRPVGDGGGFATSINQMFRRLLPEWDEDQIERTWTELFDRQIHRTPGIRTMITDSGIRQLENRLTPFGLKVALYIAIPS